MLGILWSILKIIGMILLLLIGIILFLVAVILFVPVRYQFSGSVQEDEKKVKGKVAWLFSTFAIPMTLGENGWTYTFRICGIDIKRRKKRKKKISEKERKGDSATDAKERLKTNLQTTQIEKKVDIKEEHQKKEERQHNISEKKKKEKKSIFEKINHKIKSVRDTGKKLYSFFRKSYQKTEDVFEKKRILEEYFWQPEVQEAKQKVTVLLKKTCHHILPRKLKARLRFGLEYPDETGKLYALLCVGYGRYGQNLILEPDFEQMILEGEFSFQGRIRVLNMIYYGISFYRIKKCKDVIRFLKNL